MDRAKRIALISEHASPTALLGGADAGGQNVYVDEISRHLARRGYAIDVFTRRDDPSMSEVIDWAPGVRVVNVSAGPVGMLSKDEMWPYMPAFRDFSLDFMLRNHLRYDLLHGNFWMSGWVAGELGQRLGIPVVQLFHALGMTKRRYQQSLDTSPPERISVEMDVMRLADKLIAQCPNELDELVTDYGADPAKITLLPAAVNSKMFYPISRHEARQRLGLEQDEFVIVYVGRLLQRKDVRNVVRGVALLLRWSESVLKEDRPKIRLLVVGGDTVEPDPVATPEIGALQQLVHELGIQDAVHFVGKRRQDALRYYYSAANVAVTTPWYEPFGLTPLEAMACGRPVIGSAVGGIAYTVIDTETGFLVPPCDPEYLMACLYRFLLEPGLCERMGRAARLRVEQEFTWPVTAMRTASLYESLITSNTSRHNLLKTMLW